MNQTRVVEQAPPRAPREKLTLGRKSAAPAPIAAPTIVVVPSAPEIFPLGRLRRADENVRHTRIEEGCAELADDIQAHGLLSNLIGYQDGEHVEIVGGGRRLKALRIVRDRGHLDDTFPVPVLIRGIEEAVELSLAENLQQRNMSPVDEFLAFAKLMERGDSSPADLAKRFGFSERVVKQRLRLAQLARPILDALGNREITLDAAMAYASSSDTSLQVDVFEQQRKRGRTAHDVAGVKLSLRMKGMDTANPLFRFVGAEKYEREGGGYEDDLFDEPGRDRVLAQPFLAETIANTMVDFQALRLVDELRRDEQWSSTIRGVVKVPDLRIHSYGTQLRLPAPTGFVLVERADHPKLWRTIRNNGLPCHVVVGLDAAGELIADPRYAFVPNGQKAAIEKPLLVEKAEEDERAKVSAREMGVIRWSRRLAIGSFAGTPFEGRVLWPNDDDDRQRPHTLHGEAGYLVSVYVFAPDTVIAASRKAAIAHVDAKAEARA